MTLPLKIRKFLQPYIDNQKLKVNAKLIFADMARAGIDVTTATGFAATKAHKAQLTRWLRCTKKRNYDSVMAHTYGKLQAHCEANYVDEATFREKYAPTPPPPPQLPDGKSGISRDHSVMIIDYALDPVADSVFVVKCSAHLVGSPAPPPPSSTIAHVGGGGPV